MTGIPAPGPARLTVVIVAVVSAVLAYPWRSTTDRWALGIAVAVVLISLIGWGGRYLTRMVAERIRILLSRKTIPATPPVLRAAGADAVTTVLVRVDSGARALPLGLLTGYLDRYGLVCDAVRVTTRTAAGDTTTWVSLAFSGARNLAALQARSPEIPLRQTAENAARRLASHLRESGWTATLVDADELPDLAAGDACEQWRTVSDARGYLTTYAVSDPQTALAAVSAANANETWTVIEIAGPSARTQIRAAAAIRTTDRPAKSAALQGLTVIAGRQARALTALHPLSGMRLV